MNVALLDQQHQGLFDTVNELERALRVGEGNAVIDGILDRLVTYAGLHFAAEESLMERHSFPGLPTHRIQHEMFRKKMTTLLARHRGAKAGVAVELGVYLTVHVAVIERLQLVGVNVPAPLLLQVMEPVGVSNVPGDVSVTLA